MDKYKNVSPEQAAFLQKQRNDRLQIRTIQWMLFAVFLISWELASDLGCINSFIFCSPSIIGSCFIQMIRDGMLFQHIGITLLETIISFCIVILASILIAIALWWNPKLSKIVEPYMVILNSLPKSALAPVLIVWLGSNVKTIVVAAVSVAVFGSVMTLHTGFQSMDPDKVKLIYTLGGTKRDVLGKVLLPGAVPLLISNMKVNIGLCLVGVIIGEFLAADKGLGYLIIYGSQVFKLDLVILSIVILCVLSMGFYRLITLLEKRH